MGNTAKQWRFGTVSRLRFCRRSWGLKIYFWWNIWCFFGSHTFVLISWMCKKQTSVSHSSTESEIFSLDAVLRLDGIFRSRFMGSDCFSPWKTQCRPMIERGDPLRTVRRVTGQTSDLKKCSTFWIMLIVFFKTSNFRIKKLCCMCLRTTKQLSRWSWREEGPQWDMSPGPTELCFIGYSIEPIWTPKNQNQIHWHQKPTRRHSKQGKLHTWWMESSVVLCMFKC